ncbi:MAG TPA: methyltransferase [Myxococcota bacterium]|jgi:protein-S-isoprenylcysteine O-methyltransferase Ste14
MTTTTPATTTTPTGALGGALFRWRLAVIVGFFFVGLVLLWVHARHAELLPFATFEDLVGKPIAFWVCAPISLLAFILRTSGEARLGSVVYGQSAALHVVTGGPFRLLRHPLYAGTWLFFVATYAPWVAPALLAVLAILFALCLRFIAAFEEQELARTLGDAWSRYAAAVPRFLGVPKRVDDDGIKTTPQSFGLAVLGNLALLSMAIYRILVASDLSFVGLGALNLACLLVWIVVVCARRLLRR